MTTLRVVIMRDEKVAARQQRPEADISMDEKFKSSIQ
jgi:hypothetical protein